MLNEARLLSQSIGKQRLIAHLKFSTTQSSLAAYKKSFQTNIGATNPLIDGPDFTFLDGRPTSLTSTQKKRAIRQKELMERSFMLMKQIDFAVDRFNKMTEQEKAERRNEIESKFREKNFAE